MKNLKRKLQDRGGFTLIEMLIVVAIIAILIAVSIPLVGSALEEARKATDAANERAFKSALVSSYLLHEAGMDDGNPVKVEAGEVYAYDAVNGAVKNPSDVTSGYSKSKEVTTGKILYGYVKSDGTVYMLWDDTGATHTAPNPTTIDNSNLLSPNLIKSTT